MEPEEALEAAQNAASEAAVLEVAGAVAFVVVASAAEAVASSLPLVLVLL